MTLAGGCSCRQPRRRRRRRPEQGDVVVHRVTPEGCRGHGGVEGRPPASGTAGGSAPASFPYSAEATIRWRLPLLSERPLRVVVVSKSHTPRTGLHVVGESRTKLVIRSRGWCESRPGGLNTQPAGPSHLLVDRLPEGGSQQPHRHLHRLADRLLGGVHHLLDLDVAAARAHDVRCVRPTLAQTVAFVPEGTVLP